MTIQWGDVASWVSGIGTISATGAALYFALRQEGRAEASELGRVYCWARRPVGETDWELVVENGTEYPIYRWKADLTWADPQGAQQHDSVSDDEVGLLPPGRERFDWKPQGQTPPVDAQVAVEIRFRDRQGRFRVRTAEGGLKLKRRNG